VFRAGPRRQWQVLGKFGLAIALAASVGWTGAFSEAAFARESALPQEVALADLPPEARATQQLIHSGGPFPYPQDGSVFRNREQRLPAGSRGYYREYTGKTPDIGNRGARRIVCGGPNPASLRAATSPPTIT
jgi:ribonuclease T1